MNLLNDEFMLLNKRFYNLNDKRYIREEDGIFCTNKVFEDLNFSGEASEESYLRNCNHITFTDFSPSRNYDQD